MTTEEKLTALKDEIDAANAECKLADDKRKKAESAYASEFADSLGVSIGSIVTVKTTRGYAPNTKSIIRRYRIESIGYKGYGKIPLNLIGTTIRQDGSDGEKHEIWQDWKLEAPKEIA